MASERKFASGQVVDYIRQEIRRGALRVGDRLPNEAELAKEIGVGRSSLREGIQILAAYGLVEVRQGEGSFIIDKTAEQFFPLLGIMPVGNYANFHELRRVIEVGNIAAIYNSIPDSVLNELEELNSQLDYKNGLETCTRVDREFHRILLTSTGNPLLVQLDKMLYQMRSEQLYKYMCYPDVVEDARRLHDEIVEALRSRDRDRCIEVVTRHLDITAEYMEHLNIC